MPRQTCQIFLNWLGKVTKTLGVPPDAPAIRLLTEAKAMGDRDIIGSLIPADRIWGLLERDFLTRDIHRAVATALTPQNNPDFSAHKSLLGLATTQQRSIRLL